MSGDAPAWICLGGRVRGAAHVRAGLPCQDAVEWTRAAPRRMALADGHGSPRSFRSDRGARFAVRAALEASATVDPSAPWSALKPWLEERLPREIVRRWREAVDADLAEAPLNEDESRLLKLATPDDPRRALAYGSTLLLVAATDAFVYCLQLGDGDILAVADAGEVFRPLPEDPRLFANETTSLCMENAWREARVALLPPGEPPALLLAATDGYANSFRDRAGFERAGPDFLALLREEGVGYVEAHLEEWLDESSRAGSGDDIALGLLYRPATGAPAESR